MTPVIGTAFGSSFLGKEIGVHKMIIKWVLAHLNRFVIRSITLEN